MIDIITLIKQIRTVDANKDVVLSESSRDVFASVRSIGQKEFYEAQALGFKPEIKFVLSDYEDYDGEQDIIHNGIRYNVLRTYRTKISLEITCTREVNES